MSEDKNKENENKKIDLSQLADLEFQTAWSPSSSPADRGFPRKNFGDRRPSFGEKRPFREGGFDRRPKGEFKKREGGGERKFSDKPRGFIKEGAPSERPRFEGKGQGRRFEGKGDRGGRGRFENRQHTAPFKFTMEVLFYPEDAAFAKLADLMKRLKRTYQLFDVANLFLEKPERFIVVAKNLPSEDGKVKPLYCAQPQNLPFTDEATAKRVAVEYYLEELFKKETVEAEAPKGNFQVVNKCTLGGELLGAPNWHRYNEFLREFHASKYPNMSFERFLTSIESSRNADEIAAWLESMKHREVYKLKEAAEGEEDTFETKDNACNYILRKYADGLVKEYEQVRMRGSNIALLPQGAIRRNIEEMLHAQRKFPIVTANNLRGRLRRGAFAIYKRGSKSFAYVSAVKRKFLTEGETLAELPQKIFTYITDNRGLTSFALPYLFLGLETPKASTPKSLAEEHKHAPDVVPAQAEVAAASEEAPQAAEASAPEIDEEAEKIAPDSAKIEAEVLKYSDEDLLKIRQVSTELMWLISEGYIVEYADATLLANPYMPKPKAGEAPKNPDEAEDETHVELSEDIPSESEASDAELADGPAAVEEDSAGEECEEKECLPEDASKESEESKSE